MNARTPARSAYRCPRPPCSARPSCASRGCSSLRSATSRRRSAYPRRRLAAVRRQIPAVTGPRQGMGAGAPARTHVPVARRAVGTRGHRARTWLASDNLALAARPRTCCARSREWSVSSRTWTPRAVASDAAAFAAADVWRAVEAQHVVSTSALVDTLDEQHVLERILDEGKPAVPGRRRSPPLSALHAVSLCAAARRLAFSRSQRRGRVLRRRRSAHRVRRTRLLALAAPARCSGIAGDADASRRRSSASSSRRSAVDLREPPFLRDRETWTQPDDYGGTPALRRRRRATRASARSATNRCAIRSMADAARCCAGKRLRGLRRSSSRRGCCRSRASASCGSALARCAPRSTNSRRAAVERAGMMPASVDLRHTRVESGRAWPHRLRDDVARDAGVHRCARRGHAGRDLADRASADLHAGTCGTARAPVARQRHSRAQGRPRRADHLSRPRTARRVYAVRSAAIACSGVRDMVRSIEASVIQWLESVGISAYGKAFGAGCLRRDRDGRGEDRRARTQGAQRLHLSWARGEHRDGPHAVRGHRSRAAIRASPSRSSPSLGVARTRGNGAGAELAPILAAHLSQR